MIWLSHSKTSFEICRLKVASTGDPDEFCAGIGNVDMHGLRQGGRCTNN